MGNGLGGRLCEGMIVGICEGGGDGIIVGNKLVGGIVG